MGFPDEKRYKDTYIKPGLWLVVIQIETMVESTWVQIPKLFLPTELPDLLKRELHFDHDNFAIINMVKLS